MSGELRGCSQPTPKALSHTHTHSSCTLLGINNIHWGHWWALTASCLV